jgi:AraC family transcriptional regulator of adaptative response / DNA-3-methyladenine glycosylase II
LTAIITATKAMNATNSVAAMGLRLHPRHPGVAPLDVAGQRLVHGLVAKGEVRIDSGSDPTEVLTRLVAIPGIGPWTAAYVAMRGFHDPDAFPHGDAGLRRALQALGRPHDTRSLADLQRRWRPWRAYAALQLWTSLDL